MPEHRYTTLVALGAMVIMGACAGSVDPPAGLVQPAVISPRAQTATPAREKPTLSPVKPGPTEAESTVVVMSTSSAVPELPTPTPTVVEHADVLTADQRLLLTEYPPQGAAPELRNEQWLNSEPLRLAGLRGKVVLLDMWTFG